MKGAQWKMENCKNKWQRIAYMAVAGKGGKIFYNNLTFALRTV